MSWRYAKPPSLTVNQSYLFLLYKTLHVNISEMTTTLQDSPVVSL